VIPDHLETLVNQRFSLFPKTIPAWTAKKGNNNSCFLTLSGGYERKRQCTQKNLCISVF
jgi:hypothetical protein